MLFFCADTPSGPITSNYNVTKISLKIGDIASFANAKTSFALFFPDSGLYPHYMYKDNKRLVPVVCLAELV